jgi:hypothetical protein
MMSDCIVLQIAETRLAISCDQPSFQKWLLEVYGGFITQGEPHLRCNLRFDYTSQARRPGRFLSMTPLDKAYEHGELEFKVASSSPAEFFWLILQVCLRCAIAMKQPPDLMLHASGVIHEGMAYIFTGASGAGKSTVCKLLAAESSFNILHDEVVAVSHTGNCFHAWSTPFRGEMPTRYRHGAPLRAIFFLKKDLNNYAVRLSSRKVAELLCYSLIPPMVLANGTLAAEQAPSLKQILTMAEVVPGYELHFRPESSFWECIPGLFKDESVVAEGKEGIYVQ